MKKGWYSGGEDKKCKRELARGSKGAVPTEREPCWVCAGGGRWQSGGLCIRACGCVSLCAVCKGRSAIFNIPVSPDLEYQNNLSGSIQMLLPLHTFLPPPPPTTTIPPPPPLLCFLPSLSSHIWSAVSTAIPPTKLIFVSNGGLSLNKTFVVRDHRCVLMDNSRAAAFCLRRHRSQQSHRC